MKKLILIIALALVSTGAWGYGNLGHGAVSCGTYVKDKQEDGWGHQVNINWVLGFVTGGNVEREMSGGNQDIGEGVAVASMALWLENYCRENPLKALSDATVILVEELKAKE